MGLYVSGVLVQLSLPLSWQPRQKPGVLAQGSWVPLNLSRRLGWAGAVREHQLFVRRVQASQRCPLYSFLNSVYQQGVYGEQFADLAKIKLCKYLAFTNHLQMIAALPPLYYLSALITCFKS